ncbi:MAG: VOC family protein [Pseudomonadota bacterium]
MQNAAFSMSLAVKDLATSISFYSDLGFEQMGGDTAHGFVILRNGSTLIGLFQGMFEGNILTFNPGWDQSAQEVEPFDDVRALAARMKAAGVEIEQESGLDGDGPGSFVMRDPDGNVILIDQHR